MFRSAAILVIAVMVMMPWGARADQEASAAAQRDREIREYIDAITKANDENLHSCIADKWEKDEDLNADSGITQADLDRLLNPPGS